MAIGGGDYELRATFKANVDQSVNRSFSKMEKKLADLEKKMAALGASEADPSVDMDTDKFDKKEKTTKGKMKKLGAETAEAKADLDTKEFDKKIGVINKRLTSYSRQVAEARADVNTKHADAKLAALQRKLSQLSARAYDVEVDAEMRGVTGAVTELEALERKIADVNGEVIRVRTNLDSSALSMFGLNLTKLVNMLPTADAAMSKWARNVYFMQQAAAVAAVALGALAVAASGPLLAGLTVLGSTALVVAGGFGLIAAAAAPIISHFANASQRASELESAQNSLKSSTDALKTAQQGLADAQEAVGTARQQGAEQVKAALQAEEDAARAVGDAQRTLDQAHSDAAGAAEELEQATDDLNYALQTEQMRLRSMRYDIQGMKLSQKELALEIKATEKELAKGDLNAQERQEAQLRLKQLELQRKQGLIDIKTAQKELTRAEKQGTSELQSATEARDSARESVEAAAQAEKDAKRQVTAALTAQNRAAQATEQARKDAAAGVEDALEQVARAEQNLASAAEEVAASQNKVNSLLAAAPKYIRPLENAVNRFKETYATSFASANRNTAALGAHIVKLGTSTLPTLGRVANQTVLRVGQAIGRIEGNFRKFGVINNFRRILAGMPRITQLWTMAIGRFAGAFLNIMGQAMPYVRQFSRWVNNIALQFLKWTNSQKGRKQIQQFFQSAAPVARVLWHIITRIAGALLSWSIKHPQRIAEAIREVFRIGVGLFNILKKVYNIINSFPGLSNPIHTIIAMMVLWMAKSLLLRAALYGIGVVILRVLPRAVMALVRVFAWAFSGILSGSGTFIARLLLVFGRLTVVGAVIWYLVNVFRRAYQEILNHTIPTLMGLQRMYQQHTIGVGSMLFNMWRQIAASIAKVLLQALVDTFRQMENLLGNFLRSLGPVGRKLADVMDLGKANKNVDKGIDKIYNAIRGGTNKSAEVMGKNLKEIEKDTSGSMGKASKTTGSEMKSIHNTISKESQKAAQSGKGNFKDFNMGSSKEMNALFGNSNKSMKDILGSTKTNTGQMKSLGIKNFTGFQSGGTNQADTLRGNAMAKALAMQIGVNKSTNTMKEKGIASATELQSKGNAAMGALQDQWVKQAWDTAVGTVAAFNAILKGMAAFIESSGVTGVKKPSTIELDTTGMPSKHIGSGAPIGTSRNPSTNRGATKKYRGGEEYYKSGGSRYGYSPREIGPVGGISNGTTRVFGEIPGTREFYITDNPAYRKRNMDILAKANAHMLKEGGVMKFAAGGSLPPKGAAGLRAVDSQGRVGYSGGPPIAAQGAQMWNGLVINGSTVKVYTKDLPSPTMGMTYSGGRIALDPSAKNVAAAHEFGHALGLGHGGNSVMGGAGRVTPQDFQALQTYYGVGAGGGQKGGSEKNPTGGSGGGGSSKSVRQNQIMVSGGKGGGSASIPGGPSARGGSGGGSANTSGLVRRILRQSGLRMGSGAERYISGIGEGLGPTTHSVAPEIRKRAEAITRATGTSWNSYEGHGLPGGSTQDYTVDFWGPGGRGSVISRDAGLATADLALTKYNRDPNVLYVIRQGEYWRDGAWKPWPQDPHMDHTHVSWVSPTGTGTSGAPARDFGKEYDKKVPSMKKTNYGAVGAASQRFGDKVRGKHREQMLKKLGDQGLTASGSSPGGLSLGEAVERGGWGSLARTAVGVAYEESGGRADARNPSGAYGLFQVMPETAKGVGANYSKLGDPIYNSQVGKKVYDMQGWGAWVAYPPSKKSMAQGNMPVTGYARGGVFNAGAYKFGGLTRAAQVGLMHKNEMNVPLDDPRAVRALGDAFKKSRRAGGHTDAGNDSRIAGDYRGGDPMPVKLHDDDINRIGSLVLSAIWSGLESPKGGEKMDENLGRRWEKNARTKGEM
jgi:hypothetical protein